jgi:hypothetical protein
MKGVWTLELSPLSDLVRLKAVIIHIIYDVCLGARFIPQACTLEFVGCMVECENDRLIEIVVES